MKQNPISQRSDVAVWLYRHILKVYPVKFRRRSRDEMILVFSAEWQRVSAAGTAASTPILLLGTRASTALKLSGYKQSQVPVQLRHCSSIHDPTSSFGFLGVIS